MIVNFCNNLYFDNSYNDVVDFPTSSQQLNYYRSITRFMLDVNMKADESQTELTILKSYSECNTINYLFFTDNIGKTYYYFITSKEKITDNTTLLYLELDVYSTYLFDITILPSYVDRCHVKRWENDHTPTNEIIDEGVEFGEPIVSDIKTICDLQSSFIIASSDPLGEIYETGGGNIDTSGENYRNGYPSANIFRFIKGYEGFAPYPYSANSETFRTVGYGCTEAYQKTNFDKHMPFPCTEQKASEIFADMIVENFGKPLISRIQADGMNLDNMKQQHFDAFLSLAMNGGIGAVTDSPMYSKFLVNPSDPSISVDWLSWYVTDMSGNVNEGLVLRRKAEANIYQNGKYEFRTIPIIDQYGNITGSVEGNGYIPPFLQGNEADKSIRESIVMSARKLIGLPYVWGGLYPPLGDDNGTDCSGLMQWAFNDNGRKISRVTYTQIKEGRAVDGIENAHLGDLIFTNFSSPGVPEHVFMYSGKQGNNYMCVEAQKEGVPILERAITQSELNSCVIRDLII